MSPEGATASITGNLAREREKGEKEKVSYKDFFMSQKKKEKPCMLDPQGQQALLHHFAVVQNRK